jgi:hypothetical protein
MKDIEQRLRDMAFKWRDANRDIHDLCRDAIEEIIVLKTKYNTTVETQKNLLNSHNYGNGWGKGKDE